MSIQIGTTVQPTSTTYKERILLQSATESNLIILSSSQPETNIVYSNFTQGRSNNFFTLKDGSDKIFDFNSQGCRVYKPYYVSNVLTANVVSGTTSIQSPDMLTSNMTVVTSQGSDTPFFNMKSLARVPPEIVSVYPNGRFLLAGPMGIGGVTNPRGTLDVQGNAVVTGSINAGSMRGFVNNATTACNITITQDAIVMNGTTRVLGDFEVVGTQIFNADQSFRNMFVSGYAEIEDVRFHIPRAESNMIPLTLQADWGRNGNLVQFDLLDPDAPIDYGAPNVQRTALTLNAKGYMGLGTSNPEALIEAKSGDVGVDLLSIVGVSSNTSSFLIKSDGNVSIGSSSSNHRLHIAQHSNHGANAVVGVYSMSASNMPPFMEFFDTNQASIAVFGSNGSLRLGKGPNSANYGLDLAIPGKYARLPLLETSNIVSMTGTISMNSTSLSGVQTLEATNIETDILETESITTNFIFASNYEILAFQGFDSNTYGNSVFNLRTSNLLFRGDVVHFDKDQTAESVRVPGAFNAIDGKVRIINDDATQSETQVHCGLLVSGARNASIRVASTDRDAMLELQNVGYTGILGIDRLTSNIFLKHKNNGSGNLSSTRLQVTPAGRVIVNRNSVFEDNGNLGVALGNIGEIAIAPTYPLEVKGPIHVKTVNNGLTAFFVDASFDQQLVGIGTTQPFHNLHVLGKGYFSESVGIGTYPQQGYALTINGPINLSGGDVFTNGAQVVSSQWTSNILERTLTHTSGSVGIGTTTLLEGAQLHVEGSIYSSSNVTANGTMYATGSFVSTSDRSVKSDLEVIKSSLDRIAQLTGYTFSRRDRKPSAPRETGLIAQDVLEVMPEAVIQDPLSGQLSVAYGNLAGLFVEAFKELNNRVSTLEALAAELVARTK